MSKLQSVDIDKEKFKEILKKKGYTQQSLADTIYCSQQYISKCKWGIDIFERICAVLEISPEDILLYPLQTILTDEAVCDCLSKIMEYNRQECIKINGIDENFIEYIQKLGYSVSEKHGTIYSKNSIITHIKFEKDNISSIFTLEEYLEMQNSIEQMILNRRKD